MNVVEQLYERNYRSKGMLPFDRRMWGGIIAEVEYNKKRRKREQLERAQHSEKVGGLNHESA